MAKTKEERDSETGQKRTKAVSNEQARSEEDKSAEKSAAPAAEAARRIEVVGYIKEQPRARVVSVTVKGKTSRRDVADVKINCEKGEVKIDGQVVDPHKNQWHKLSLWGIHAIDAVAAYPRGTKVRVVGKHHVQTWGDKGEKTTSEIKLSTDKDGNPIGIDVLEKPKDVPTAFDGKGQVLWRPTLERTAKHDSFARVHFETDAGKKEVAVFWDEAAQDAARRLEAGTRVRVQGERVEVGRSESNVFFEIQRATMEVLPPREQKKEVAKDAPEQGPSLAS